MDEKVKCMVSSQRAMKIGESQVINDQSIIHITTLGYPSKDTAIVYVRKMQQKDYLKHHVKT